MKYSAALSPESISIVSVMLRMDICERFKRRHSNFVPKLSRNLLREKIGALRELNAAKSI